MKNAIILHGTDFHNTNNERNNNWFPWLEGELIRKGFEVFRPELPNALKPNIQTYQKFFKDFDFNAETILIGHSSGATAILGLLERLPVDLKISKAILVAGFSKDEGWNCEALIPEGGFNWSKIKTSADEIIQIHSDNDPYVTLDNAKVIAGNLEIPILLYPNHFHFSIGSGGEKFAKVEMILKFIN